MRPIVAITKNVAALSTAFEALDTRDDGIPGMGLVSGLTGAGKTKAVTWQVNQCHGVYVRATSAWTPTTMLSRVLTELGLPPMMRRADMLDKIAAELAEQNRPLFVDETDKFIDNHAMLECLRDIHDISSKPVILIGEEGIQIKLKGNPRLARRITEWVEFLPADLDDARLLARDVCDVPPDEELLLLLHTKAKGSIGLMVAGLGRIERLGKANGLKVVTAEEWGTRPLFLSHVQD